MKELQLEGWRLLSLPLEGAEYRHRVLNITQELFNAGKRERGGQIGIKDQYYFANDRIVFERMIAGESQAAAIKSVYGDDASGVHKKRIQRRKTEMKEMADLIAAADLSDRGH